MESIRAFACPYDYSAPQKYNYFLNNKSFCVFYLFVCFIVVYLQWVKSVRTLAPPLAVLFISSLPVVF